MQPTLEEDSRTPFSTEKLGEITEPHFTQADWDRYQKIINRTKIWGIPRWRSFLKQSPVINPVKRFWRILKLINIGELWDL